MFNGFAWKSQSSSIITLDAVNISKYVFNRLVSILTLTQVKIKVGMWQRVASSNELPGNQTQRNTHRACRGKAEL